MRSGVLASIVVLAAAGCTLGPRHVEPETRLPAAFDQAGGLAGESTDTRSSLWTAFGSTELDALLQRAAQSNQGLAQALARLNQTRAIAGASIYAYVPTVTAAADAERRRPSQRDPLLPLELGEVESWRAGFDASWEIDLFGSLRNRAESIRRRVEADAASLEAVRQSVLAETAQAWFSLIGARQRLELLENRRANLGETARILEVQVAAGQATALDLARAESLARAVAAGLPLAEAEVVRHEQRLAVLTAWPIEVLRAELDPQAAMPDLPPFVNTGTPEQWLRRRPDTREAERRLAAATADVGVEVAEYFPRLELVGAFGWTAGSRDDLGTRAAERWSFGPALSWRFLDVGRVRQTVTAAEARREEALATYRETVLRALEETENALATYRAANQSTSELELALRAAEQAETLAWRRYAAGATDYLVVLDAQRTRLELAERLIEGRTRRATALAAVHKALAGDP